jgi:hypothetical protein
MPLACPTPTPGGLSAFSQRRSAATLAYDQYYISKDTLAPVEPHKVDDIVKVGGSYMQQRHIHTSQWSACGVCMCMQQTHPSSRCTSTAAASAAFTYVRRRFAMP